MFEMRCGIIKRYMDGTITCQLSRWLVKIQKVTEYKIVKFPIFQVVCKLYNFQIGIGCHWAWIFFPSCNFIGLAGKWKGKNKLLLQLDLVETSKIAPSLYPLYTVSALHWTGNGIKVEAVRKNLAQLTFYFSVVHQFSFYRNPLHPCQRTFLKDTMHLCCCCCCFYSCYCCFVS